MKAWRRRRREARDTSRSGVASGDEGIGHRDGRRKTFEGAPPEKTRIAGRRIRFQTAGAIPVKRTRVPLRGPARLEMWRRSDSGLQGGATAARQPCRRAKRQLSPPRVDLFTPKSAAPHATCNCRPGCPACKNCNSSGIGTPYGDGSPPHRSRRSWVNFQGSAVRNNG